MKGISLDKKVDSLLLRKVIAMSKLGEVHNEVRAFNTNCKSRYKIGSLNIYFEDGATSQGDGKILVHSQDKIVLSACVSYAPKDEKKVIRIETPPLGLSRPFLIREYNPGNWERRIENYKIPRKSSNKN